MHFRLSNKHHKLKIIESCVLENIVFWPYLTFVKYDNKTVAFIILTLTSAKESHIFLDIFGQNFEQLINEIYLAFTDWNNMQKWVLPHLYSHMNQVLPRGLLSTSENMEPEKQERTSRVISSVCEHVSCKEVCPS